MTENLLARGERKEKDPLIWLRFVGWFGGGHFLEPPLV